jgi:hypothetical protein
MPGAHDEIRTLLRRGTARAVTALATELRDGERAISLVSGSVNPLTRPPALRHRSGAAPGAPRRRTCPAVGLRRAGVLLVAQLQPRLLALNLLTLGVLKRLSCHYVLRIADGQRVTLTNIRPERRGFTVARRIEFHRQRSRLPSVPIPDALQEATAVARQQLGRLADRVREAARGSGARPRPENEPALEHHDEVSDADLLSHLLALHEAGLITDAELAAKRAALEQR